MAPYRSPSPAASLSQSPEVRLALFALATVGFALLPFVLADAGVGLERYPWNFSPILPLALYAGATVRNRAAAAALPVGVWAAAGLALWAYTGSAAMGFPTVIWWVYAGMALSAGLGFLLRSNRRWWAVGAAGLGAGATFFVVSNFGVWVLGPDHSLAGLAEVFLAAIPFYRGTLLSLAVFLPALFLPSGLRLTVPRPVPTGPAA